MKGSRNFFLRGPFLSEVEGARKELAVTYTHIYIYRYICVYPDEYVNWRKIGQEMEI